MGEYRLNLLQNYIELKLGLIKKLNVTQKAIKEVAKDNQFNSTMTSIKQGDSPRDTSSIRGR